MTDPAGARGGVATPPARGGQARPVRAPGPAAEALQLTQNYADLPSTAKVGLRAIPPAGTQPIDFILDEDAPLLAQRGGGGWVVTERWGRKAITSWGGVQPYELTMSGLFVARYQGKEDVEAFCHELQKWYQPRGDFNAPVHVRVVGASPGTDREWLIDDLVWKPPLRNAEGKRRIAPFDLTLLEFVDPDSVIRATASASDASNRKRIYVVKSGDTLTSIARNRLGDARRADDIRRANLPALAGGDRALKPQMQILLPAGKPVHKS